MKMESYVTEKEVQVLIIISKWAINYNKIHFKTDTCIVEVFNS